MGGQLVGGVVIGAVGRKVEVESSSSSIPRPWRAAVVGVMLFLVKNYVKKVKPHRERRPKPLLISH